MVATGVISSVVPSGLAALTLSLPMRPPAPALFSTMTGWPSASRILSATRRDRMSLVAPAGKPTTIVTVPCCAATEVARAVKAKIASSRNTIPPPEGRFAPMVASNGMTPPYRADHVGSLLRPPGLSEARKKKIGDWKELQNRSIREVIRKQEAIGLQAVTDGEFSREWWHLDFLSQLEGVVARENPGPKFGGTDEQPPIPNVTGKLRYARPVMVDDFSFLKKSTGKTAKFTIPSPSMLHLRAGRAGISREAYPDLKEFWADAAAAYRAAIAAFAAAGCTYLQLDDVAFAYLCDPKIRDNCRKNGDDPENLP